MSASASQIKRCLRAQTLALVFTPDPSLRLVQPYPGPSPRRERNRNLANQSTPFSPPSGLAQRLFQEPPAKSKFLAVIDLNPVRAGMVKDPADYRWSSYGEAIGGGSKGNGKTARAGLVRALRAHKGSVADAGLWANGVSKEYRKLLMAGAIGKSVEKIGSDERSVLKTLRKGISKEEAANGQTDDGEIPLGKMLRCRIRYFTDGAVIGSRSFVDEAFVKSRERFGAKRKNGARKLKGDATPANGFLWSLRDLRKV